MIRVLLIEDDAGDARLVEELLKDAGAHSFEVTWVRRLAEAVKRLGKGEFDAALLDLGLPDARELEGVAALKQAAPDLPIVVLTGLRDEGLGIRAVQSGAQDYLIKGHGSDVVLARSIRYAIERKRGEQHINHMAHYDGLTNLPNRRLLLDRLEQALARTRRNKRMLAVLFLDLNEFKTVNDTLGHPVGDLLLQSFAERLRGCMRESDTVARLGGDEFTLILPEVMRFEDVTRFAEKVFESLQSPFTLDGKEIQVSASMGISLYPNDGNDPETLLRNADTAMYRAKQQGGSTYQFYFPVMNLKATERLALSNGLRRALEHLELVMHYQPQVDLRTGEICGVEGLVRWRHPDLGLVPPVQFIPLAEELGLIIPIDDWVLLNACNQARLWHAAGFPHLRVSVNLSSRQFQKEGVVAKVGRALDESGLKPEFLELELTESGVVRNEETTVTALRQLSALGVRLSIDDFGTGYSSLSHLRQFPIDTLKIDQSFIRDIATSRSDAAIVSSIISMAHGLRLRVVAEGVESAEQLAFLRQHRCDLTQGFYFSHPLPAEELTQMLQQGPPWNYH